MLLIGLIKYFTTTPNILAILYNVPGGKLNRGLAVLETFVEVKGGLLKNCSSMELENAAILGWCVEFVLFAIVNLF
jgi:hypothetical protein